MTADLLINYSGFLLLSGDAMVYLGPIELRYAPVQNRNYRLQPTTAVAAYGKGRTVPVESETAEADELSAIPGGIERRKRDRRDHRDNPLLETRTGRDRRKSKATINISI